MDRIQIELAVARATGESFDEIRRRGFGLADPFYVAFDPEPPRRCRSNFGRKMPSIIEAFPRDDAWIDS